MDKTERNIKKFLSDLGLREDLSVKGFLTVYTLLSDLKDDRKRRYNYTKIIKSFYGLYGLKGIEPMTCEEISNASQCDYCNVTPKSIRRAFVRGMNRLRCKMKDEKWKHFIFEGN